MTRSYGLRWVALAAVVVVTLTACSSGAPDDTDDADAVAVQLEAVEQSAKESVPSALVLPLDDPLLPPPLVDLGDRPPTASRLWTSPASIVSTTCRGSQPTSQSSR